MQAEVQWILKHTMTSENLVCRHGSTCRSTYINVHVFTWRKEITCHVNCVVIDISYFHLRKKSRPLSGSSKKRRLIWVNSVCKSVKRRLCEATDVCHKQAREANPCLYFYSCQSYPLQFGAHILPWLKCVDIVELIPM